MNCLLTQFMFFTESKHKHLTLGREDTSQDLDDKKWNETKIFILPLMPTDEDEKKVSICFVNLLDLPIIFNLLLNK